MATSPHTCPNCGAFVRHTWVDNCGDCGAVLVPQASTHTVYGKSRGVGKLSSAQSMALGIVVSVLVIAAAGTIALTVFGNLDKTGGQAAAVANTTTTLNPSEVWTSFSDPNGQFTAEFPGVAPTVTTKDTFAGKVVDVVQTFPDGGHSTHVHYGPLTAADQGKPVDDVLQAAAAASGRTVNDNRFLDVLNHRVLYVRLTGGGGVTDVAYLLDAENLYSISVTDTHAGGDPALAFQHLTGTFTLLADRHS